MFGLKKWKEKRVEERGRNKENKNDSISQTIKLRLILIFSPLSLFHSSPLLPFLSTKQVLSSCLVGRNGKRGKECKEKKRRENEWKIRSISFSLFGWTKNSFFFSYFSHSLPFPFISSPPISFNQTNTMCTKMSILSSIKQ